jgi:hypothetical protein
MALLDLIRGRQVIVPLTNKSGGSVAPGDVVIVDTANNDSFTTTTSANSVQQIGVAQETIANNASGRVLVAGYAPLVNVNASVTRGRYLFTHTVAKQAAESATYGAGAFAVVLTSGATPTACLFGATAQSSTGMSNPLTTTGDIIYSSAGTTAARRAIGTLNGMELRVEAGVPVWGHHSWNLVRLSRFDVSTGWTASAGVTATYAQVPPTALNAYPHGRVYGVKLVVAAAGDRYIETAATYRIALETGKTVSFSVYAKSLGCSDICSIRAIFQTAAHGVVSDVTIATLAANQDWTLISGNAAVPATAAEVALRLDMDGTGDYYFAGLRVEYGSIANAYEPNPADTAGFWA